MDIHGLQKMTLLDYPDKVACTVFLGGCNLRCPYCHNSPLLDGSAPPLMGQDELLAFLRRRRGLLDGVCVTGGEPLLQPGLEGLLEAIRALDYPVKLDTNGTFPRRLENLVERGLVQYVAMDLKNSPARYPATVGVPDLDLGPIRESVSFLLSGAVDYEFRTTVVRQLHDADAFRDIAAWIAGARAYFLQSFVDRDTVLVPGLTPCSQAELEGFLALVRPLVPAARLRGA